MRKAAIAGAIVLATISSVSITPRGIAFNTAAAQEITVTNGQIARLKAALRLTGTQEARWHPVEAALRAMTQKPYRVASADAGLVERTHARVASYTIDAGAMSRLYAAAQPLIATLSGEQRQAGITVLRSMGISF